MQAYVYLVLTFQFQVRLSILDNLTSAVDAQHVFKSKFTTLINEDFWYQHWEVQESLRAWIIKSKFFNRHRNLYASKQFKLKYGKDNGKEQQYTFKPMKDCLGVQHEQTCNQKILAENHNVEKLAITLFILWVWLIAYHFS